MHESYDTLAYDAENQYLYVSGNYKRLVQIDITTKKELSVASFSGDVYASVVVDDCLYVTQERQLFCMDKKTLAVINTEVFPQPIIKLITFCTDKATYLLCVGWYESMVHIVDCKKKEIVFNTQLSDDSKMIRDMCSCNGMGQFAAAINKGFVQLSISMHGEAGPTLTQHQQVFMRDQAIMCIAQVKPSIYVACSLRNNSIQVFDCEQNRVIATIPNPQGSDRYLSLHPLGMDRPMTLSNGIRYFLLKDHQSLTLLDMKTLKARVIAHCEIDRSFSAKGSVPGLNSIVIAPSTRITSDESSGGLQIFSCESGW